MIFARKIPEFYTIIVRKIIFPIFFWGGAHEGRGHVSPRRHMCLPATPSPRFLRLRVVIGLRDNGFPGPAVALDGPA